MALNHLIGATMAQNFSLVEPFTSVVAETLQELSEHHRYSSYQLRARGLLPLNARYKSATVAVVLQKMRHSIYNWAKLRRADVRGILPRKLL